MFHKLNRAKGRVETNMFFNFAQNFVFAKNLFFRTFPFLQIFAKMQKTNGACVCNPEVALALIYAVT